MSYVSKFLVMIFGIFQIDLLALHGEVSAVVTRGEIVVLANCKSTKGNKSDFFVFYYKTSPAVLYKMQI